jgi:hypothetical protein
MDSMVNLTPVIWERSSNISIDNMERHVRQPAGHEEFVWTEMAFFCLRVGCYLRRGTDVTLSCNVYVWSTMQ